MKLIEYCSIRELSEGLQIDKATCQFVKRFASCETRDEYNEIESAFNKFTGADLDLDTWQHFNLLNVLLNAFDFIIEGFGLEYIGRQQDCWNWTPKAEYVNTGDTYSATIILKNSNQRFYFGCWADIAEREERGLI